MAKLSLTPSQRSQSMLSFQKAKAGNITKYRYARVREIQYDYMVATALDSSSNSSAFSQSQCCSNWLKQVTKSPVFKDSETFQCFTSVHCLWSSTCSLHAAVQRNPKRECCPHDLPAPNPPGATVQRTQCWLRAHRSAQSPGRAPRPEFVAACQQSRAAARAVAAPTWRQWAAA